jgi:hypothetical protein
MNNIEKVQKILNKLLEFKIVPDIYIETDRLGRLWIDIKTGYHFLSIEVSDKVILRFPDEINIVYDNNIDGMIEKLIKRIENTDS